MNALTLRELIAAQVVASLTMNGDGSEDESTARWRARIAVQQADALIAALAERPAP